MKYPVRTCCAFLSILVASTAHGQQQMGSQPDSLIDTWSGKVQMGNGTVVRVVVKIAAATDGTQTATLSTTIGTDTTIDTALTIVNGGGSTTDATDRLSFPSANSLSLSSKAQACTYSGALDSYGRAIVGTFTLSGQSSPLVLARAEKFVSNGFTRMTPTNSFLIGDWSASAAVAGKSVDWVFHITTDSSNHIIGSLNDASSPTTPAAMDVRYRYGHVRISIDDIESAFIGQPSADQSTIAGTLDYQGTKVPMTLTKKVAQ